MNDETAKMTEVIVENESIQHSYAKNIIEILIKCKIDSVAYCNEISEVLCLRNLKV